MGFTTSDNKSSHSLSMAMLLVVMFFRLCLSVGASDMLRSGESLSGNRTLTSRGQVFELGFFKPGKSLSYYIGIWYKKPGNKTVVWVANRNRFVSDPSLSTLKILEDGKLTLVNPSNETVWSSARPNSTSAVLLDSGNFVARDESGSVTWQSFDHPTDTWLPGGKIGYNKVTNENLTLTPWKNPENPAPGIFSLEIEPNGTSHLLIWNGSSVYWSSGFWTGTIFSLVPEIQRNQYASNITYISDESESYFTYEATHANALTRFMIDTTGQLKQLVWGENFGRWNLYWMRPSEQCQVYAFCGAFAACNQRSEPLCVCLKGFRPSAPEDWALGDHSGGCTRNDGNTLSCGEAFAAISDVRVPPDSEVLLAASERECRSACLSNCSCSAYAYGGDGRCSVWKGDLLNVLNLSPDEKVGKYVYVKIGATGGLKVKIVWIVVAMLFGLCLLLGVVVVFFKRRRFSGEPRIVEDSLVMFRYRHLKTATKNFSEKVGEGGFGAVFRGMLLPDSSSVAVKVLKRLRQGEKQFRAEVKTIGTVQHVNLVNLRGFCAEASKRVLVYDFMPNGSLESALFEKNPTTKPVLDWRARYEIAIGTARGLCYLHEECIDRIIHCDVKPENILLDSEYTPRLADFGLAKLVGRDFSRVLTTMRGTRGYLAPEWLSGQAVTPKVDVFSYGMVLFELVSGQRNSADVAHYYPGRVLSALIEGDESAVVSLLDPRLDGEAEREEVVRACKVAGWCIQDDERDRPSMSVVVRVLTGVSEVDVPPLPVFIRSLTERAESFGEYNVSSGSSTKYFSF